jgi:hypothetical protein
VFHQAGWRKKGEHCAVQVHAQRPVSWMIQVFHLLTLCPYDLFFNNYIGTKLLCTFLRGFHGKIGKTLQKLDFNFRANPLTLDSQEEIISK